MFRKLFVSLALVFVMMFSMGVSQCSLSNIYPTPAVPICGENPDVVLCKIFGYAGLEAEQVHAMLLDATLVPVGFNVVEAQDVVDAIETVIDYVETYGVITMNDLVAYIMQEANANPAFAMLLSRRLSQFVNIPYWSTTAFDSISRQMVLDHLYANRDQFAFMLNQLRRDSRG